MNDQETFHCDRQDREIEISWCLQLQADRREFCTSCEQGKKIKNGESPMEEAPKIKRCKKCGITKALTEFTKHFQCKDGYTNTCQQCTTEIAKKRRQHAKNPENTPKVTLPNPQPEKTKICLKCEKEWPITEFYRNHRREDGRETICKTCRESQRQKRKENEREKSNGIYTLDFSNLPFLIGMLKEARALHNKPKIEDQIIIYIISGLVKDGFFKKEKFESFFNL